MALPPIEHVVVLMFENRSFDHVFGALPNVDGVLDAAGNLKPGLYNLPDPLNPPSPGNEKVFPTGITLDEQQQLIPHDFNHDFCDGMIPAIFGPSTDLHRQGFLNGQPLYRPVQTWPPTNSGFISVPYYPSEDQHYPTGRSAMNYFKFGELPVLHKLAQEFVVCDHWFCDMPGHTKPNRAFMHCATSGNLGINDDESCVCSWKTIFQLIDEQQPSWGWRIYSPCGKTDASFLKGIRDHKWGRATLKEFAQDVANGQLPFYSFIMCWSGNTIETDSSMHPASLMQPGENLLAAVYNALLASPKWNQTLLIVTFDENGGMYDHFFPPPGPAPTLGCMAEDFYHGIFSRFDFTLLGPRIPAILISPWLKPGVDQNQYQNTSILRYIEDLLAEPGSLYLTERDRKAQSIAAALDRFGLPQPRTDCHKFPGHPGFVFALGLSDFMCPDNPEVAAAPHWAEVEKIYGE